MTTTIRTDEWLAELDRIYRASNKVEGITTNDIAAARDVDPAQVRKWLRKAINAGQWECKGYVKLPSIDGRMNKTPVYGPRRKK